ncbi:hypothetical protein L208DRAFT_1390257 [Tricholoma matsutake]|nr:hypothetical protein L208DRAFT_1390257 [Tricholoma matsutake 945]
MQLRHHFRGLDILPPALLSADLGLVSRPQSIVDWVETYNLRGGRPIVEGRQWPIIGPSLHGPHPIGRALAYSTWDFIGKGWTTDVYTYWGWGAELQSKGQSRSFNHDCFFFSDRCKLSLPVIDPVFVHQLCSSLTAGSLGAHAGSGSIEYHSARKHISQSCKLERAW